MMRVAILYICTGAYVLFWEQFYRSFSESFLPETEKDYYVFTDASSVFGEEDNPRIHRIPQDNLGWPGNTLFRFRIFLRVREELKEYDYIFFMNANLKCLECITTEEFLPQNESLLMVQHPGNYNRRPYLYPYDRNRKSRAYIPYKCLEGKNYVFGALNGGKAQPYLSMIEELDRRTDEDYEKGIIARWHDESQLNRYVIDFPDYRLLTPAYCYPEDWDLPFPQKILVLEKSKYITLDPAKVNPQIKGNELSRRIEKGIDSLRNLYLERYFAAHSR